MNKGKRIFAVALCAILAWSSCSALAEMIPAQVGGIATPAEQGLETAAPLPTEGGGEGPAASNSGESGPPSASEEEPVVGTEEGTVPLAPEGTGKDAPPTIPSGIDEETQSPAPEETGGGALPTIPSGMGEETQPPAPEETDAEGLDALSLPSDSAPVDVRFALVMGEETVFTGKEIAVFPEGMPEGADLKFALYLGEELVDAGGLSDGAFRFTVYHSGSYTLRAEAKKEEEAWESSMEIVVHPTKPESVSLKSMTIGVGETCALDIEIEPWYAEAEISFSSNKTSYVRVDAMTGEVKGVKAGSATVTVSLDGVASANCVVSVKKTPSAIALDAPRLVLGVGETMRLAYRISSGSASGAVRYSIVAQSEEGVLSVDAQGCVEARTPGWATVEIRTFNDRAATQTITVLPAPKSLALPEAANVSAGGAAVSLVAVPDAGSAGAITYSVSDETKATVDAEGNVKGLAEGEVVLTALAYNGVEAQCHLTILPEPVELKLNAATITIGIGETFTLKGETLPENSESELTFQSSKTKYATVGKTTGEIKGVRAGTATIGAFAYNGIRATCKVVVKKKPTGIALNAESVTLGYDAALGLGEEYQFTVRLSSGSASQTLFYSIVDQSAQGVISLTENGHVTATGIGWADVKVETYNGKADVCRVTVSPAPGEISLEPELLLGVGQIAQLAPSIPDGTFSALSFEISNPQVVAIDAVGKLKGLVPGRETVTVSTFNGHQATVSVEVRPAPGSVSLESRKATLGVGDAYQLEPLLPEGTATEIRYSSNKSSVASVNSDGLITARKKGSATITVSTHNGKKITLSVTVKPAPGYISFQDGEIVLHPGDVKKPAISISKGAAASISFASDNPEIASVDAGGFVTANAVGAAVITATTYNGKTASATVRVVAPPAEIRLEMEQQPKVVAVGELLLLPVRVLTEGGDPYEGIVTVSSSNTSVLGVNSTNMLGRKPGNVTVTIRAGALAASFSVKVLRYADVYGIDVLAHRGLGMGAPENSLEGIQAAALTGAAGVEIDVRRTRDGVLVLCHDETVNRTSNGKGRIEDMTYQDLLALDFGGTKICTLEEALEAVKGTDLKLFIEFKAAGVAADSVNAVNRNGMGSQAVYFSFDLEEIKAARLADPEAKTALLYNQSAQSDRMIQAAVENGIWALIPKYTVLTENLAAKIHAAGLLVGTYTINTKAQLQKVYRLGLDLLVTDFPSQVVGLLK